MSDGLREAISRRVFVARTKSNLTQEQLAEIVERSVEAVSNIERGISLPTIDTLERIAKAVAVPLQFFFEEPAHASAKSATRSKEAIFELGLIVRKLRQRDVSLLLAMARAMQGDG